MNFKTIPDPVITPSLLNRKCDDDDDCYIDPYQKKEVSPSDLDNFSKICQKFDYLCSIYNIPLLEEPLSLMCEKFKEDPAYSKHCFEKSLVSKDSCLYLISIYSSESLPKKVKWLLVKFFVEASFHIPEFSKEFCQKSHAFNYLLNIFANPKCHEGHLQDISNLIINIVSDCPTFFSPSYVIKLSINAFKYNSLLLFEKFSYFIMNFLRFYTSEVDIEIYHPENVKMIEYLQKWFQISYGFTFEHMLWSFYFWFMNSSKFTNIFYETFFFDVVMSQLKINPNEVNEVCLQISLSIIIMALITDNQSYEKQMFENLDISNIISLIFDEYQNIGQETKIISLRLISNYAARGPEFIDNLLENQMHTKILDNFENMKILLKTECGYCFAITILEGNQDQSNYFTDEHSVQLLLDCIEVMDEKLVLFILRSFVKLTEIKSDVFNYIDPCTIDEIKDEFQSNEEIASIAQNLLSNYQ